MSERKSFPLKWKRSQVLFRNFEDAILQICIWVFPFFKLVLRYAPRACPGINKNRFLKFSNAASSNLANNTCLLFHFRVIHFLLLNPPIFLFPLCFLSSNTSGLCLPFTNRSKAIHWLLTAKKLLPNHDLVSSKSFGISVGESDSTLALAANQILAINYILNDGDKCTNNKHFDY